MGSVVDEFQMYIASTVLLHFVFILCFRSCSGVQISAIKINEETIFFTEKNKKHDGE